jgi:hypothetical protein
MFIASTVWVSPIKKSEIWELGDVAQVVEGLSHKQEALN